MSKLTSGYTADFCEICPGYKDGKVVCLREKCEYWGKCRVTKEESITNSLIFIVGLIIFVLLLAAVFVLISDSLDIGFITLRQIFI